MQQRISRVLAGACVVAGVGLIAASPAQAATRTGGITCASVKYGDLTSSVSGAGYAQLVHQTSGEFETIGFDFGSTTNTANIPGWVPGGYSTFTVNTDRTIYSASMRCNY